MPPALECPALPMPPLARRREHCSHSEASLPSPPSTHISSMGLTKLKTTQGLQTGIHALRDLEARSPRRLCSLQASGVLPASSTSGGCEDSLAVAVSPVSVPLPSRPVSVPASLMRTPVTGFGAHFTGTPHLDYTCRDLFPDQVPVTGSRGPLGTSAQPTTLPQGPGLPKALPSGDAPAACLLGVLHSSGTHSPFSAPSGTPRSPMCSPVQGGQACTWGKQSLPKPWPPMLHGQTALWAAGVSLHLSRWPLPAPSPGCGDGLGPWKRSGP